ncbi:YncE family protein [Desulfosporosinus nitroreducens]|uniref:YncE family protein n=1 Tax=Desulfosporosinus nitroreducens TaxID=2018668 RepID=UPI00207C5152|nr:YncE family protein [Desulfosporosinus nitroreducens]MCO1602776.1 YncE family protein [Desulfosporosinus nitroreducens]
MAVFDTGPIDNRDTPRTTQLTIRLFNTGRLPALVGIEVYQINPPGGGFTSETVYVVSLVPLNPFGTPDSGFTLDNVFADLDVFGVRVLTSGLGANDIAITVLEKDSAGQIIEKHVLEGELSRIQELLFAYVTNLGNDSVTVINTATNTILTTISLPDDSFPKGVAITPDGSRAYVTNRGTPDSVTVINTATNTIVTTIPLPDGSDPAGIAITPDGSRAYVTNSGTPDSVTVINTATNTILTTIPLPDGSNPEGIAITPDGSRAYVTNFGNDTVTVINTATNTILTTIILPAGNPAGIAITPDGSRAYVTNSGMPDSVTVINTAINSILTTIILPAGTDPFGIAITPDGSRAYVANNNDESVMALDTAINGVIATLPAEFNASGIAITPILLF